MDNAIFATLWYTLEAANEDEDKEKDTYYAVTESKVSEKEGTGTATIKNMKTGEETQWYWDSKLYLWFKGSKGNEVE